MTQKIDFVEMARKLMANKVILKISQDPKRLAEVILAGHLKNAYELGWKEALASHAPSEAVISAQVLSPEDFFVRHHLNGIKPIIWASEWKMYVDLLRQYGSGIAQWYEHRKASEAAVAHFHGLED